MFKVCWEDQNKWCMGKHSKINQSIEYHTEALYFIINASALPFCSYLLTILLLNPAHKNKEKTPAV